MFDELNKKLLEGQKNWAKVEKMLEELKNNVAAGKSNEQLIVPMFSLLIDHLRPLNPDKKQVEQAAQDIKDLLDSLK